jgi:hypothetical protein
MVRPAFSNKRQEEKRKGTVHSTNRCSNSDELANEENARNGPFSDAGSDGGPISCEVWDGSGQARLSEPNQLERCMKKSNGDALWK